MCIRDRIKTILNIRGATYTEEDKILLTFTRSLPLDLTSLADSISKLRGIVSNKTLMSQLDFVTDVKLEQEQMDKERQEEFNWQMKSMDLYSEDTDTEPKDNNNNAQ